MRHTPPAGRDYGYCNARVRGMRSRLMDPAFFDSLMDAQDMNRLIQALSDTEYAEYIDAAIIKGRTPAAMDEAFRANMVGTFQKVTGFLNAEAYDLVTTLLGRWDLFNIKSLIRGKHMNLSGDEIQDGLYAVGALTPVELNMLGNLDGVRAVVDTLWTWGSPYAEPLRSNLAAYEAEHNLTLLELALDRYYSGWAAARLTGRGPNTASARRILGLQIDSVNLLTTFRLLKSDVADTDVRQFFLPGGEHIAEDLFMELAALSDVDEVLDKLQRTPYGKHLEAVVVRYIEEGSLAVFERALEDYVMRRALAAGRGDPLGVGIVIGYLWAKQNEITNLRIIVKGKSVGMPADRMRKELILV
ncbi:MAG: ATP synthase A1 subunit C [Coriobacteriia bacterium]|nr:ATP synthase A1 subunit C [Coriobacteriia bacterium]